MPFRATVVAQHEGRWPQEVFAPQMTRQEWQSLQTNVREGKITLHLPCCSTPAYLRTSALGLQHFYHQRNSECSSAGETVEHLRAKWLIFAACRAAGWDVTTEWSEAGWCADVLATQWLPAGTGTLQRERIAFEVQWSPQTCDETIERQLRYKNAGVSGVWLFHRPPPQVQNHALIGSESRREHLEGYADLPLFYLREAWYQGKRPDTWDALDFYVYINARRYPLTQMVQAWLAKEIILHEEVLWRPWAGWIHTGYWVMRESKDVVPQTFQVRGAK